jgi:signal transduction histidine kinase
VLTLNQVGSELLGIAPIDEPVDVADCLDSHPELLAMLRGAVGDGVGLPRQEIRIKTAGEDRTLGFTVHVLKRDDGTVRGHLALFADLTESHREAEARQLANSLEQLGELAAGVAHELRNSLATLRGYLTLIERHPDEESITDYLAEIRRETDHLRRVVEDFLSFAQPESARVETVDLLLIARRAAADPALKGAPVVVEAESERSWQLPGDAQLLERALRNLMHNAVRAERDTGTTGPVRVRLAERADLVELSIDDRGPGIPDTVRDRLFQPFVTGRSDGVGLGLSLAHRIVTLHGGRLYLDDRSSGGTRASILFPVGNFV